MKTKLNTLIALLFLIPHFSNAATCTAIASTNWTLASTWSCGYVPLCTDDIVIPSGFTVTINTVVDLNTVGCSAENTTLIVNGQLFMSSNASRLYLPLAATITINAGGRLHTDVSNNSQKINIGGNVSEWDSNTGDLTGPWKITVNSSISTLPIELLEFKAKCQSTYVQLNWITATEKNNDYFIIERSSDAQNWEEITKISGKGNTSSLSHYVYNDIGGCKK